jgi:hypothetical protein
MKKLLQTLGVMAAAGLGLALGFTWRGQGERQFSSLETLPMATPASAEDSLTNTLTNALLAAAGLSSAPRDDSPLATQLAPELAKASRVTRWLYWLEGIEQASLSDFPRLAPLANGDATMTRLLALRWVELDLPHLFHTLATMAERRSFPTEELAEVLFDEWVRREPDAAIAALRGTNRFGTHEIWRFNVAAYLIEKDPERGLRALSEWGIDDFAPRMTGLARWAAVDPRHAAAVTMAHPAGYTSDLAMETIGKEWARTDPARAMEFAAARPGALASLLASTILKEWAGQNVEEAGAWLAAAGAATCHRFSPAFVEAWAKTDIDHALAWCDLNLSGRSLAQTVGKVVSGVARTNLARAAEYVLGMTPSVARAEAAAAVAKNWFPGWRSGKPAPPAALAWLTALDAASARRALEQVQWKWSNGDPKSMAGFLATAGSDKVPPSAELSLARALARQNPVEALAWARGLPEPRAVAAGREAFAEWRRSQPESAVNWLNDLPTADPRRELFLK